MLLTRLMNRVIIQTVGVQGSVGYAHKSLRQGVTQYVFPFSFSHCSHVCLRYNLNCGHHKRQIFACFTSSYFAFNKSLRPKYAVVYNISLGGAISLAAVAKVVEHVSH